MEVCVIDRPFVAGVDHGDDPTIHVVDVLVVLVQPHHRRQLLRVPDNPLNQLNQCIKWA